MLRVADGDWLEGGNHLVQGMDGEADFGPARGLGQLHRLIERVRTAGVPVRLAVTGEHRDRQPGAGQCAYRVAQEALTNVLKHACPAGAQVTVAYEPRRLTVADDGLGADRSDSPGGHGLMGMRERARTYGGRLQAGPRARGGFEVWPPPRLTAQGNAVTTRVLVVDDQVLIRAGVAALLRAALSTEAVGEAVRWG